MRTAGERVPAVLEYFLDAPLTYYFDAERRMDAVAAELFGGVTRDRLVMTRS